MRNLYFFLLFIFSFSTLCGQLKDYRKEILKADDLLRFENYNEATLIYDNLIKQYPDDAYLQFKAAECYLFSERKIKKCIELLEKALPQYPFSNKNNIRPIEARYYLGQAYHLDYRFKDALKTFENLKTQIPPKRFEAVARIEREIQYCKNAIELKSNPVQFTITNLGPVINTEYDEHSPVINLHEDMLLFTSNRKTAIPQTTKGERYVENIFYSLYRDKKWITTRAIDINTGANNATIGISPDGTKLLVYQNDGIIGNIYISEMKNDQWGELKKLPTPINTMANETHASFSLDGKTLFFTSDRMGGFGGKDIYSVRQLPNGEWGKVRNLGPYINTEFDEASPYIHPNGKSLYFSSQGHQSMGGFDIFKASLEEDGQWGSVKNIGYPINSPFDDLSYAPTLDEQRVYYASKKNEGFGGADIYLIEFPEDHPNELSVVGGFVYTPEGSPAIEAKITVTEKKTGLKEGVYRPNANNGKYIFIIPCGKDYTMEVELEEHKTIIKNFKVPPGKSFARKKSIFYLDPLILKVDK